MFRIIKPPIILGTNMTHLSTSWQVYTSASLSTDSLILNITKDTVNLLSILIDLPLSMDDVYYVRDKLYLKSSTNVLSETDWSKPVMVSKNINGFSVNNTIINTPRLMVDFNPNQAPLGDFNIEIDKYVLFTGVGVHKSTDWVIEDMAGNTVYKREKDTFNKNKIRIPSCTLKKDTPYIIKTRFNSDTNVTSNYGKLLIATNDHSIISPCDYELSENESLTRLVSTVLYEKLLVG